MLKKPTYRSTILVYITMGLIFACTSPVQYITRVDMDKYNQELKPGMTQDEINEVFDRKRREIEANSIGRRIPEISIEHPTGKKRTLNSLINKTTLVALSSAHCSWGMTGLEEDLPKALKKLEAENIDLPLVCLLIRDSIDYTDTKVFDHASQHLQKLYPATYIIDKAEADKLNVSANPTRLLINKNEVLEFIGIGVSTPEGLYRELLMITKSKNKHEN